MRGLLKPCLHAAFYLSDAPEQGRSRSKFSPRSRYRLIAQPGIAAKSLLERENAVVTTKRFSSTIEVRFSQMTQAAHYGFERRAEALEPEPAAGR